MEPLPRRARPGDLRRHVPAERPRGSPSASTGCSPTAPSRPARGCATRWRSSAPCPSRERVIDWVADHRKHHTFTDEDGDPHSPHAGHGAGLRGMVARPLARPRRLAVRDPRAGLLETVCRRSRRGPHDAPHQPRLPPDRPRQPALPFLLGLALSGGSLVDGGLTALLWAGLVRIFLVHHVTWSINSHLPLLRRRRFDDRRPVDQRLLARPPLPRRGLAPQPPCVPPAPPSTDCAGIELDPSGWLILGLERVGLAWDVVEVTPERARAKLAGAAAESSTASASS